MKQLLVTISGTVQRVSFRDFLKEQAEINQVTGWAKNTREETVEALFQGEEQAVGKMIKRCLYGPSSARVTGILIKEVHAKPLKTFEIIW